MSTYFECASGHYIEQHRGESLGVGDVCPARPNGGRCQSKLRALAQQDRETVRCSRCKRGLPVDHPEGGKCCSWCGVWWKPKNEADVAPASTAAPKKAVTGGGKHSDKGVTKKGEGKRPLTGAERVAKHRAKKKAEALAKRAPRPV